MVVIAAAVLVMARAERVVDGVKYSSSIPGSGHVLPSPWLDNFVVLGYGR
jgi:hypothetical protein